MEYMPFEITDRIKRVREKYLTLTVPMETNAYSPKKYKNFGTGDRWLTLGYLRGWEKNKYCRTTLIRASLAEAEELYQSVPQIYDDELLVGHLYLPEYTDEEQAEYDRLCSGFEMSCYTFVGRQPRKCHIGLDFEKLLKKGVNGVLEDINAEKEKLCAFGKNIYPDFTDLKKWEFYECMEIELKAVLDLAKRYSEKAFEMAEISPEPRKSELIKIGEIMKNVPAKPAENFYEAIQSVQFYLSTLFGLYPLGRPDKYLCEYYERDINNGILTKEFAQELVDNFCLYVSDRVFTRAACGFIVGGTDKNGNLVENDLTYMFLTALRHIKLPDPNGALAVNEKTSDDILKYASEILASGTTHPAFYNDKAIINSFVENYNCTYEDAVNYIHATCAEMSIAGKSKSHSTPFQIDLPKFLVEAVKRNPSTESIEEILCTFSEIIKENVIRYAREYAIRIAEASRNGNGPMRICAFIDDCIAKGKSIYEGGERYTFIQPIFIGFATMVDSLYAYIKIVLEEKKLSSTEFLTLTENNFEGNEELRQYIIRKISHYGNDEDSVDKLSDKVSKIISDTLKQENIPLGKIMMPGTFSYINHAAYGEKMTATFDGRLAGYSYSDGCGPVQGRDTNGPTSMVKSLTSWNQSEFLGGMVVNIKFGAENLKGDKADNFISVLKTFIQRGGLEMQVNVVDREVLLDALENPQNHPDLMVRIGGYSDYFVRLTPTLQREVIDRTQF